MDNSAVLLSFTDVAIEELSTIKRYNCNEKKYGVVKYPAVVKKHNEHMGGVELFVMLMALSKFDHKGVKWYQLRLLWAFILATINIWHLYCRNADQHRVPRREQPDLLRFATSISATLIEVNKSPPAISQKCGWPSGETLQFTDDDRSLIQQRQILAASNVLDAARSDRVEYFLEHNEPK